MKFGRAITALCLLVFAYYGYVIWGIKRGKAYLDAPLVLPLQQYRMIENPPLDPSPCPARHAGTLTFAADSEWMLRDTTIICQDSVAVPIIGMDRGRYRFENGRYVLEGPSFARTMQYGTASVAGDTLRLAGVHFGIRTRTYVLLHSASPP
jgi:hypothetical protein